MRTFKIEGVACSMITPFKADNELDEKGLRRYIDFLVKNGVTMLIPAPLVPGEMLSLSDEEWASVIRITVEQAKGEASVIAWTGHTTVPETIRRTKMAEVLGADAAMVMSPFLGNAFAISDEELYEYYKAVAQATGMRLIPYSGLRIGGVMLKTDILYKLASEFDNIICYKTENPFEIPLIKEKLGDRLQILVTPGPHLPAAFDWGVRGFMYSGVNLIPARCAELYSALIKNDPKKSRLLGDILLFWNKLSQLTPSPAMTAVLKEAMNMIGLPAGKPRSPFLALSKKEREKLRAILKGFGLLTT